MSITFISTHLSSCYNNNIVGRGRGDRQWEIAKMERRWRGNRLTVFQYIKAAAKKDRMVCSLCLQRLGQEARGLTAAEEKKLSYGKDCCDVLALAGGCVVSIAGGH